MAFVSSIYGISREEGTRSKANAGAGVKRGGGEGGEGHSTHVLAWIQSAQ